MSVTRRGCVGRVRTCANLLSPIDRRATDYSTTHRSLEAGSNRRPSRYEGDALAKLSYPGMIHDPAASTPVLRQPPRRPAHRQHAATAASLPLTTLMRSVSAACPWEFLGPGYLDRTNLW